MQHDFVLLLIFVFLSFFVFISWTFTCCSWRITSVRTFFFSVLRECFKDVERYIFFFLSKIFFCFFFFCADWCDVSVFWSACQCSAARDSSTADLCEHLNTSGLLNNTLDLLLFYSTYPCYVLRDGIWTCCAHTLTWFSLMMRSVSMGIPRNVCFFLFKKLIIVNVFFKICQTKNIFSVNTALCHLKPNVCCYML